MEKIQISAITLLYIVNDAMVVDEFDKTIHTKETKAWIQELRKYLYEHLNNILEISEI